MTTVKVRIADELLSELHDDATVCIAGGYETMHVAPAAVLVMANELRELRAQDNMPEPEAHQ
jgi:hypothetical protein